MPYAEYKESGRTAGKLLYQLQKIGIPLTVVETLTVCAGEVIYYNKPFATYHWCGIDTPIFTFEDEYVNYNSLEQPEFVKLTGSELRKKHQCFD